MQRATVGEAPRLTGPLTLRLALRFLRGRRSRLLGSDGAAALAAVDLGVTAMVRRDGADDRLPRGPRRRKLVGGNAAVIVYPLGEPERGSRPGRSPRRSP